ncbi:MAG: PspA/IM30 family protein [Rhodothermia bacterium]|nr:PspA/IM30 family protein [Rhodothermia bacterium]
MSIWSRFTRWVRSIFGGAISALEDPRLILEQNMRELNDQVPKMNENIATVKANVMLLQKEARRYDAELVDLTSKIKAGIKAGREDIAQQYAIRLEEIKEAHVRTNEQLKYATAAYDKAIQVKKAFMREKDRKIQEAKDALRAHERAKWQAKIADTLEQFEVGGVDQTHDEMLTRIQEQTAKQEARMEVALDSIDSEAMKIEEDARTIRASEIVKQFKLEMGLDEGAGPAEEPKLEVPEQEAEQGEKTLGKQRTQTE